MQENNILRMTEYLKWNIHPWGRIVAVTAILKVNYLRLSFILADLGMKSYWKDQEYK